MDNLDFNKTPTVKETDAFELADFETPVSGDILPSVVWSIEKHKVAQMLALSGLSKSQISRETGVPLQTINKWVQHGEFSDYVNKLVLESATLMKAKRLQVLTKILDARIAEAEKVGDYARLSKLDTLDIIDRIRKETGDDEDRKESKYTQILEKLVGMSSTTQKPLIDVTPPQK